MTTTTRAATRTALTLLMCSALLLGGCSSNKNSSTKNSSTQNSSIHNSSAQNSLSSMLNYLGLQQENELPDPEQLSPEQTAQVICETRSRRLLVAARDDAEELTITAIDAQSLHSYWSGLFNGGTYPSSVRLMPGKHVLQVQYRDAVFYGDGELKLDAEAGKTYKLRQKVLGLSVQFWLEDSDGQQVGSAVSKVLHGVDRG